MKMLKQVEPRTSRPYGFECERCGAKFPGGHRTEEDARLAAAIHDRTHRAARAS